MYDGCKIIIGIIVFLVVLTSPVWYVAVSGQASSVPQPEIIVDDTQCIEDTEYMRDYHMVLLDKWRDQYVREDSRTHVASNGEEYLIGLTGTCLNCHSNKTEFCDQCHDYGGVKPYCWDCHIEETTK